MVIMASCQCLVVVVLGGGIDVDLCVARGFVGVVVEESGHV